MHGRYYDDRTGDEERLSPAMRAQLERYERAYGSRLDRGVKKLKVKNRRERDDWVAIH
jgi:hypothetical protein